MDLVSQDDSKPSKSARSDRSQTSFTGSGSNISHILATHREKRAGVLVTFFSRIPLLARVLLVLAIPVIILFILSGTLLVQVRKDYAERDHISSVYNILNATSVMIDRLQVERGQSSLFVSEGCPPSSNCSATTLVTLTKARGNLDNATASFLAVLDRESLVKEQLSEASGFSGLLAQVQGSLPLTRSQVNARVHSSSAIMVIYTALVSGLIDSTLVFQKVAANKEFAIAIGQYTNALRIKEAVAFCRGMGSALWGGGGAVTSSVLTTFTTSTFEITTFSKTLSSSLLESQVRSELDRALGTEAAATSFRNFDLIIANVSSRMLATGTANAYFANTTLFINELNRVVAAQGDVVRATSHLTVKNSSVVLVGTTLSVTIITCTFLTFLLILSIRSANRSLAKSLLRAKSMDAHLRKFVPSRFMSLLDITEPTKLIPGLRAEITLTMLFADVRGFTRCAEVMDPNDMFETLLQYTQVVSPVISKRNGFIDRWVGDGVFCVFQDPEEAVFAALELHSAVRVLNERLRLTNSTTPVFNDTNFLVKASSSEALVTANSGSGGETEHTAQIVPLLTTHNRNVMSPQLNQLRFTSLPSQSSLNQGDSPSAAKRHEPGEPAEHQFHPFEVQQEGRAMQATPQTPGSTRTQTIASLFLSPPRLDEAAGSTGPLPQLTAPTFEYRIGIGIHHGKSVCGVLGDSERVDGTLIGDAVNVAARLEGLCGKLGADTLISDAVKSRVTSAQALAHMRSLGPLKLAGREEKIGVWEVFDSNPEPLRTIKRRSSSGFEAGMLYAARGDGSLALSTLSKLQNTSHETVEDEVLKRTLQGLKKSDLTDKEV